MNERIRELVGQAKFIAEETINKKISKNAELDAFAEKFAELIVQECSRVAKLEVGTNRVCDAIEKHFGVES